MSDEGPRAAGAVKAVRPLNRGDRAAVNEARGDGGVTVSDYDSSPAHPLSARRHFVAAFFAVVVIVASVVVTEQNGIKKK